MKRYSLNKSFHPEIPAFLPIFIILLFYISFSISNAYSQQPTQEWAKRFPVNSPTPTQGRSIRVDSLGYIYVLADTGNSFGFIKYDSNGNLLYSTSFLARWI